MPDVSAMRNDSPANNPPRRTRRSAFTDHSTSTSSSSSDSASASTATSSPMTSPSVSARSHSTSPPLPPVSPPPSASTAISRTEPDFSFKTQPSSLTRTKHPSQSAPRGKLVVKLIQARHLSPPSSASRPYVVVTFDQNEFVSREPVHEEGEDAIGVAKPKPPTLLALQEQGKPEGLRPSTLPATPGGGPNPGEKGNETARVESGSGSASASKAMAMPAEGTRAHGGAMSKSPSSMLGRSLEEYRNGAVAAGTSSERATSPRPSRPALSPVNTTVWSPNDDPTTPTGAPREPQGGILGAADDQMAYNPTWKHEVTFDVMNEKSVLQVQIYDRSIEEEMFLGVCEIRPRLVNNHTVDQWFPLVARPGEDHEVTGEIRIQIRYEKFDSKKGLHPNDFDFLRMIGKGTFGRVFQVRKKDTKRIYAMKVLSKHEIIAKKEVAHTIGERKILQRSSDSPFLLGLKFSFQTETNLYLVMDYKSGGELFHHLQKEGRFTEDRARFYTAEIVLAFEHLHKFDIVYRDLKPENILLDATGHIVLCDFGLSKPDLPSDALTNTFCGTTEYLAPEVLLDDNGYSKIVDFWSLGVLLFEMCCGWSPFYAEDTQQMYKLICFGKVKFPRGVIGEDGKQFVKGLLNRNPKHRLGAQRDAAELKEHPFFKSIDWDLLAQRAIPPPFKPYVDSDESVANFDPEFTEANLFDEAPHDVEFDDSDPSADWLDHASKIGRREVEKDGGAAPVEIRQQTRSRPSVQPLTSSVQENFRGFTFSGENESMLHNSAAFGHLRLDDDDAQERNGDASRRSSGSMRRSKGGHDDDEWEDER
ncbi:AGC/Akt protein kinase [Rhodotorula toruloides ATCC 204091]|uniref:AGC/Akt protein kinase n=1 Tax=Rhodotorula toruloides TaxID=5286 RepID=A0A0K3CF61_RHOTO|nr:AGC/Akt protein kinase [Rhodotorula toruloides ATCC 204091]KAK4335210.1 Serine/threonine-protein kinase SCH9 [Rhodotorula toruloides]PRQ74554.1 AGC/Akt protein kinase [Rhodotorula toruloides]